MARKVYRWAEQNEASWGIEVCEIDADAVVEIEEGGQLCGDVPDGCWYDTFSHAKRSAIKYWSRTMATAQLALRDLHRLKKREIYSDT